MRAIPRRKLTRVKKSGRYLDPHICMGVVSTKPSRPRFRQAGEGSPGRRLAYQSFISISQTGSRRSKELWSHALRVSAYRTRETGND